MTAGGAALLYPLASAVLWAVGALFVSLGLERLPARDQATHLLFALGASQCAGVIFLGALLLVSGSVPAFSWWLVAAGVLTFPLATGTYYLASLWFRNQAAVASQFAKVKPLLTLVLGVLLLGERPDPGAIAAGVLIGVGIGVFVGAAAGGRLAPAAVAVGLLTAVLWSTGELMMALGLTGAPALADTAVALSAGALAYGVVVTPWILSRRQALVLRPDWLLPFIAHGVISFGLAYGCFFLSLGELGVVRTVAINAFWPILALALATGVDRLRGRVTPIPRSVWLAGSLICAGSAAEIVWLLAAPG